jgi:hypothetical protein
LDVTLEGESELSNIVIETRRLSPVEAELWISVEDGDNDSSVDLSGRARGPLCKYASTVEISYPLRPLKGAPGRTKRLLIPEPSLWTPQTPFLYYLDLSWNAGNSAGINHGIRRLEMIRQGCRLNGQPFTFEAIRRRPLAESELTSLRQTGFNSVVFSLHELRENMTRPAAGWLCDRMGAFAFVELDEDSLDEDWLLPWATPTSVAGWLIPQHSATESVRDTRVLSELLSWPGQHFGVQLTSMPKDPLPNWVSFITCPAELLPHCEQIPLPKLIVGDGPKVHGPGILGHIRSTTGSL